MRSAINSATLLEALTETVAASTVEEMPDGSILIALTHAYSDGERLTISICPGRAGFSLITDCGVSEQRLINKGVPEKETRIIMEALTAAWGAIYYDGEVVLQSSAQEIGRRVHDLIGCLIQIDGASTLVNN